MIRLSNGYSFEYVVASGALAFDGKGWPWERPLLWLGLVKPELFLVVIKSLTRHPRVGNLRWYKPWSCVRLISGGSVNKVGLTNPGIEWWCEKVGPRLNYERYPLAGSIFGSKEELLEMAEMLNKFDFKAIEVNVSCPNTGHGMSEAAVIIDTVKAVKAVSRQPIILKLSVAQDYLAIAEGLQGFVEAISLNSVPWEMVFPEKKSPLWKLEQRVGGGGGGVSGQAAQAYNWPAVEALVKQGLIPTIGPGVHCFEDLGRLEALGASAKSFGAIHLRAPWSPTHWVKKELAWKR